MTDKTTTDKATVAKDATYYATRNFKDAGTERSFTGGEPLKDIDEATARNYEAAGLASTAKPSAAPAA